MKLHLPKGLRSALLACVAAFAGIGTTVSTATITGGVFAVAIASHAQAEAVSIAAGSGAELTADNTDGIMLEKAESGTGQHDITVADGTTVTVGKIDARSDDNAYTKLGGGTLTVTGSPGTARPNYAVVKEGVLNYNFNPAWSNAVVGETLSILSGATVKLGGVNTLGAKNDSKVGAKNVTLTGAEGSLATLEVNNSTQLWNTLTLEGNTLVSTDAAATNGKLVAKTGNAVTGATIKVTGTGNSVSTTLDIENGLKIDVADGAELDVSSAFGAGTGTITKTGTGLLTLSSEGATFGGTLAVSEASVKNTGSLTLANLNVASGASMLNEGSLNITGTLTLSSAIQMAANSTFTMAEGSTIDLSNMTAEGNTYTLLTGEGNLDLSQLTGISITGVLVDGGVQWTYGTDGTLSYAVTAPMSYSGGALEWNTTDADFTQNGGQVAFTSGSYVLFESGETTATLQEDISASGVEVASGATLVLTSGDKKLSADVLKLEGTLRLEDSKASFVRAEAGAGAQMVIAWSGKANDNSLGGYDGALVVVKDSGLALSSGAAYSSITVQEGGHIEFTSGNTHSGSVSLKGEGNGSGYGAAVFANNSTMAGALTIEKGAGTEGDYNGADIYVWSGNKGTISGAIDLQGQLVKAQGGTLVLSGDVSGEGSVIVYGGTMEFGTGKSSSNVFHTPTLTVNAGTKFSLHHNIDGEAKVFEYESGKYTDVTLAGSFYSYDTNADANTGEIRLGKLTVSGDSASTGGYYNGRYHFSELTGSGTLTVNKYEHKEYGRYHYEFDSLTNFNGKLQIAETTPATQSGTHSFVYLNGANQGDGYSAEVTGKLYATSFAKTGAGSLTLETLTIGQMNNDGTAKAGGILTVNYEGALTIGALVLNDNSTLAYTSTTDSVLSLGASLFEGKADGAITLDVSALEQLALSGGLDTGIDSNVAEGIFTLTTGDALAGTNVRLDGTGSTWKLVCDAPKDTSLWTWKSGMWMDTYSETDYPDGIGGLWETESPTLAAASRKIVFDATGLAGADSATVQISGQVNAATITVEAAEGKTYTFAGDGDAATDDGIATGTLTKKGAGTLVIKTGNDSTGALTIEAGEVQINGGDWAGDIAVNGTSTLDAASVSDAALGTITAAEGATVTVGDALTITSLTGGKFVADAADKDVTLTSVADLASVEHKGTGTLTIGNGLTTAALTNAGGTVALGGDSTITTLDNSGTITTAGKALTITTVTNGGTVDAGAGAVTLGSNATFSGLTAGAVNAGANTLTLTGKSSVQSIGDSTGETGTGSTTLVVSGGTTEVKLDSAWTNLAALSLSEESRLTVGASLKVDGDISRVTAVGTLPEGTQAGIETGYCLKVGGAATIAGDVEAGSYIAIGGDADVSGSLTTAGGYGSSIGIDGNATVGGNVTAKTSASIGGAATIGGDLAATGDVTIGGAATITGALSGAKVTLSKGVTAASLTATGDVTVGDTATIKGNLSGANITLSKGGTIGDVDAGTGNLTANGTLTLGTALRVGGTVSGVTKLDAGSLIAAANTTPVLTAGAYTLGEGLTVALTTLQLPTVAPVAGTKDTYTLISSDTAIVDASVDGWLATLEGKLTLDVTVVNEPATQANSNVYEHNSVVYTLSSTNGKDIVLYAEFKGFVWDNTADIVEGVGKWVQGDGDGFAGTSPAATDDVVFAGGGTTVKDGETVGTINVTDTVTVNSITVNAADTTYTFSGGKLNVQEFIVAEGGVELDGTDLTVSKVFSAAGASIVNTGALSMGEGSEVGTITGAGSLTATGTATIGTLDGATMLKTTGTGTTLTVGAVSSPIALDIAADSAITVGSPATGYALVPTDSTKLNVTSLTNGGTFSAAGVDMVLDQMTTSGGTVVVNSLDLTKASGSTFTSVTTNALTLNVANLATVTDGLLKTGALSSGLTLTLDGLLTAEGLLTDAGKTLTASDTPYTLVSGANLAEDYSFTLWSTELQQAFALEKLYAQVKVENGNLVLSVVEDTPREWTGGEGFGATGNHWAGNENNNGGQVLDLTNIKTYNALDTVDVVSIDTKTKIDLKGADLADAADATAGLVIRELTGAEDLTITGDGVGADIVTFSNEADSTYGGTMTLDGVTAKVQTAAGTVLTVQDVALSDAALEVNGGALSAGDLTLTDSTVTVNAMTSTGDITITGDSAVESNARLTAGAVTLDGEKASFTTTGDLTTVKSLNGTSGTIGGIIKVNGTGGNYGGSYVVGGTTVVLETGADQTLAAKQGLSLIGEDGAKLTLSYSGAAEMGGMTTTGTDVRLENAGTGTLTVADGSTMTGGTLDFDVNAQDVANGNAPVVTKNLDVDGTTQVIAHSKGTVSTFDVTGDTTGMTLFEMAGANGLTKEQVTLEGDFFSRYFENVAVESGVVKADLITDYYTDKLAQSENGAVGMQMIDLAALQVNPQTGDLAAVIKAMDEHLKPTGDAAAADRLAAAVSGSGLASLGMALSGDVERQLKAIRNRTTTMGVDPAVVNENMPYFNAWINAEGDHRSLDQDSTMAGYTLTSWGGTVGFDMDVNPSLTWGLALTAMYADFSAESSEVVDGDVHTYYVSAFARAMTGAWVHTFVATVGKSWTDVNRTVNYGGGSYTTNGDADGLSFGAMYEVGRTFALNEDATACWQPVFNVAYRHIDIDGYDESGSDAGLRVGDQSMDTVTFGLGGRLQAVVGENIYNRTSIFEARALAKFDAGDRESEMDTALLGASAARGTVKSAEMDAFGVELGAGLTIPMGMEGGSIFMDGSVEFRGSYTNANATLGYRFNF